MSFNLAEQPEKQHLEALKREAAELIYRRKAGQIDRGAVLAALDAKPEEDREVFRFWLNTYKTR